MLQVWETFAHSPRWTSGAMAIHRYMHIKEHMHVSSNNSVLSCKSIFMVQPQRLKFVFFRSRSVDVWRSDGGLGVPASWERQDGAVSDAFHHQKPTLAAAAGELCVYQPPEGEGASGCSDGTVSSAAAVRGSSLYLAAVQWVRHGGKSYFIVFATVLLGSLLCSNQYSLFLKAFTAQLDIM